MTRALLAKELRALRPWLVLSVFVGLIDLADLLMNQPDLRPLSLVWRGFGHGNGIVMWIIAYAIGTGLVTREHDDRTLIFLDGLPVTRTHVFSVKCSLTCALLACAPSLALCVFAFQHLLSRGSLDFELRVDLLLSLLALHIASIIQGVFVGAAMGLLRSLTWLVTAATFVALHLLIERIPRLAFLNPISFVDVELTSAGLMLDRETMLAQLGFTVVGAAIAWWGFVRSGRPSLLADLSKRPALGAVISTLTMLLLGTGLALAGRHNQKNEPREGGGEVDEAKFSESPPAQTSTKHYHFSYAATSAKQALQLAEQSDPIFERVHVILGAPLGEPIDVDTSGSMRNTEGTAYFSRIRLMLNDRAPIVLAHETSHVVTQRLAGAERDRHWRRALVLNEGLATYVEQLFEADAPTQAGTTQATLQSDRLLLAALYTRHELLVPEISDYDLLAAMRDQDLKYPLGAAVIRAMVNLYGPDSISRLVRAFADEKLPTGLDGLALMDTTFQFARMDFAAVIAELFKEAAADAQLHAHELAAVPRPRVRLVRRDDTIGVQALCDTATPEPTLRIFELRFKPHRDSDFDRYESTTVVGARPTWRPKSQIQRGEICVQVGVPLAQRILYEPWTCLPVSDAAPWNGPDEDELLDESE